MRYEQWDTGGTCPSLYRTEHYLVAVHSGHVNDSALINITDWNFPSAEFNNSESTADTEQVMSIF